MHPLDILDPDDPDTPVVVAAGHRVHGVDGQGRTLFSEDLKGDPSAESDTYQAIHRALDHLEGLDIIGAAIATPHAEVARQLAGATAPSPESQQSHRRARARAREIQARFVTPPPVNPQLVVKALEHADGCANTPEENL